MKDGRKYLRATEIVALTGMSLRTVRRWIADEILPSANSAAPGSWQWQTWKPCFQHPPTRSKKSMMMKKNRTRNQSHYGLSGKHRSRTCSNYSVIAFPNVTV